MYKYFDAKSLSALRKTSKKAENDFKTYFHKEFLRWVYERTQMFDFCLISGGYAAFHSKLTTKFDDIDVYVVMINNEVDYLKDIFVDFVNLLGMPEYSENFAEELDYISQPPKFGFFRPQMLNIIEVSFNGVKVQFILQRCENILTLAEEVSLNPWLPFNYWVLRSRGLRNEEVKSIQTNGHMVKYSSIVLQKFCFQALISHMFAVDFFANYVQESLFG